MGVCCCSEEKPLILTAFSNKKQRVFENFKYFKRNL